MNYVRLFAGPDGESHFQDMPIELTRIAQYAKGVPDAYISAPTTSTALSFLSAPPGWIGDWHPAPRRQFMVKLAGESEFIASDGERRQIGPGTVVLLEDTTGRGHYSRVLGPDDDEWFVGALAEQESRWGDEATPYTSFNRGPALSDNGPKLQESLPDPNFVGKFAQQSHQPPNDSASLMLSPSCSCAQ